MIYKLKIFWYYVEILYSKICNFLHIKRDIKCIPSGEYCYVYDGTKGISDNGLPWLGIKPCKYYRHMKSQCYGGCTYVGFIGFDLLLGDQCKICGINKIKNDN